MPRHFIEGSLWVSASDITAPETRDKVVLGSFLKKNRVKSIEDNFEYAKKKYEMEMRKKRKMLRENARIGFYESKVVRM